MFANVFGQSILGLTASQQVNPQTAPPVQIGSGYSALTNQSPMTRQQLANHASQMFGQAYNQYLSQSLAAQQNIAAQQMMRAAMAQQQHQWMVNGRTMTFDEFLDEVCPDPDDPHRTYLTLKYKGIR